MPLVRRDERSSFAGPLPPAATTTPRMNSSPNHNSADVDGQQVQVVPEALRQAGEGHAQVVLSRREQGPRTGGESHHELPRQERRRRVRST